MKGLTEYTVSQNKATCISARDVGVILGISPFDTRMTLLLEKCHLKQKHKPFTESMKRGVYLEKEALQEFSNMKGIPYHDIACPGFNRHPLFTYIGGVPDGIYDDYLIEIKCPSKFCYSDKPPQFYNAQMQVYMQIFDLQYGYYVEYIKGENLNIIEIERDDTWWIWVLPLIKTFWDEVVYWRQENIKNHPYVKSDNIVIS